MNRIQRAQTPDWLWGWAINPLFKYSEISEKRHAQLLAGITLALGMFGVFSTNILSRFGMANVSNLIFGLALVTLFSYMLSRTKYHIMGGFLFIWSWSLGAYFITAASPADYDGTFNALMTAIFVIASALLTPPALGLLLAVNLLAIFFIRFIIPGLTAAEAYSIGGTFGVAGTLIFILNWYRSNVEKQRLVEIQSINNKLEETNRMLEASRADLELRVEERTRDLADSKMQTERRSRQFEGITRVSKTIIQTMKLYDLLPEVARVIGEQFGFYHVGIFLLDEQRQHAVLAAASSEGGQHMLARKHQLKVGEQGIVGYTTSSGRPRIALDVGLDAAYFNNPDLPLTRSEMALPLKINEEIIGALDIQSTDKDAFSNEDIEILSGLADQVSLAIQNARLFEQTEKVIAEANAIQRQYLRETWRSLPKEQKLAGFKYTVSGAVPIDLDSPEVETELKDGVFNLPISLRGEKIGTLAIQLPEGTRVSPDQRDLIQAVADRVALSAENARLFDETQKRAAQLESLNEMGRMVSQQIELKAVLLSAYEQLRRILSLDAYIIALYDEEKQKLQFPLIIDEGVEYESDEYRELDPGSSTSQVILEGKTILTLLTREEYENASITDGMLGNESKPSASLIYVPLTLGQKVIGVLSIQSYTLDAYNQSQVALVQNIANQLSIAIQNARLFEETRRRAERERIISDIAAKIGASVRTESILKTTAKELSQFLQGAEIVINLQNNAPNGRSAE